MHEPKQRQRRVKAKLDLALASVSAEKRGTNPVIALLPCIGIPEL